MGSGDQTIPTQPATTLLSLDAAFTLFDGSHHALFYHSTYGVVEEEDILSALNTANRILEAATAFHTAVHDAARLYEIEMEQIKAKEAKEAEEAEEAEEAK